ncbi:hypothetical protein [Candidatus Caldatribacterium sp.]|uniref:hypothetical protein n=1 Tax=Candidatus Caldatribacterium sp. TaxID=2282143 RepID=UPI0038473C23|nr:hypothetical protein [Candidatus Caldatribacterium sp.]
MAFLYTPHYSLAKPTTGEINWDDEINHNFDIIDEVLHQLELHTRDTNNPHLTTYAQVGAAPVQHTHSGGDIYGQVAQAKNADTVDYLHFRIESQRLQYSIDGLHYQNVASGDSDTVDGIHFRVTNDQLQYSLEGSTYYTVFAGNADTVDHIHFRITNNLLEFSTDGVNYTVAGEMTKTVYDPNNNGIVDNAERVGGYPPHATPVPESVAIRDQSGDLVARVFRSTVTSSAPLIVASTILVTNLNADMVDGLHASSFASATHNHDATYVRKGTQDTITVQHTFNPSGAPFLIGTNAQGQLVAGLNADQVDGYHGQDLVLKNNTTSLSINVPTGQTINFQVGGTTRAYINEYGLVGAVYNADLAEGFTYGLPTPPEEGVAVGVGNDGKVYPCRPRQRCIGIISYSPGILLGMTHNFREEFTRSRRVPVALRGQVKALVYSGKSGIRPGDQLTTGRNGHLVKRRLFGPTVAIALESLSPKSVGRIRVVILT